MFIQLAITAFKEPLIYLIRVFIKHTNENKFVVFNAVVMSKTIFHNVETKIPNYLYYENTLPVQIDINFNDPTRSVVIWIQI